MDDGTRERSGQTGRPQPQRRCELILQNPSRYKEVSSRWVRPWLRRLVGELAPEGDSLGIRFIGEHEMKRFNLAYRGKASSTDVLSFPGGPTPEGVHLGDVVLSVPAARRQAESRGHSVRREVKILLLHGLLHCLGHDHETDGGEMERLERRLRGRWVVEGEEEDG